MEKCPFWSIENKITLCNTECPMYEREGLCKFQILFSNEHIEHLVEFEELEYTIN